MKKKEKEDHQKLDEVLRYLNSISKPNTFKEFSEIKNDFSKYDDFELWIILRKLFNDKFISTEKQYITEFSSSEYGEEESERLAHKFYITYEGRLFIKRNGYVRQLKDHRNRSIILSLQTWLIIIGTLGAGISGLPYIYHFIITFLSH